MHITTTHHNTPQLPPQEVPPFGTVFAPYMFVQKWDVEKLWSQAEIKPFSNFSLSPAASVFHYGQEIFEGMKAYKHVDGTLALFRPEENFKRFNRSAQRMGMQPVDEADHFEAVKALVNQVSDWVPSEVGTALYLRPTLIATEPYLGVRSSNEYLHFVIACPVGAYYAKGFNPVSVYATNQYRRGVRGGTADVKAGGNYAASILAADQAHQSGYDQVLWLDALTGKNVEEVGTSNIFFVYGDKKLVTPELSGSILPGITRDSVLTLAKSLGYEVEETTISIKQVMADIEAGSITESFGTGTAAVISSIGKIGYQDTSVVINDMQIGQITQQLFDELTGIQYGAKEDTFGWIVRL